MVQIWVEGRIGSIASPNDLVKYLGKAFAY